MNLATILSIAIPLAITGLGIGCAIHALLTKTRTSTSALAWMLGCLGLPLIGSLLYLTLGLSRIKRKRLQRRKEAIATFESRAYARSLPAMDTANFSPAARAVETLLPVKEAGGNRFEILLDGEAAYGGMVEAIGRAKTGICVQFYIFDDDRAGRAIRDALGGKASQGVPVRLIYDAVGCSRTPGSFWKSCRGLGIDVRAFLPVNPLRRRYEINLRNHRKLLVVDGETAFTGSMNVSERHFVQDGGTSLDMLLRVDGPVVHDMLMVFCEDWYFITGEDLRDEPFCITPRAAGDTPAQVIESGPDQPRFFFHDAILTAIHRAEERIDLVTPYYVPDPSVSDALTLAVRRGVDVRLIVPEEPDMRLLRFATDDHLRPLLEAGARIFRRQGPMIHMKLAVFDRDLVLAGSSNLDQRSFFLNFESDLAVYGEEFASRIRALVDREQGESQMASPFHDLHGSRLRHLLVRISSLFSPIL